MRRRIIILIIVIIALLFGYAYINQSHRDIATEKIEFNVNATVISSSFSKNIDEAETKFLNKTIEVRGTITDVNSNSVTLDHKVFCQFSMPISTTIEKDTEIKIKGRVIGYDDLLEEVKLDQCTINE